MNFQLHFIRLTITLLSIFALNACSDLEIISPKGEKGADGKSAYELWKDAVGDGHIAWPKNQTDIANFFKYLTGKDGAAGTNGIDGKNGVDGTNGKSAYETWKEEAEKGQLNNPHNPGSKWDKNQISTTDFWYFLTGAKGENGKIPEIGANGNWHIDGTDTGKPAKGEKGEKGTDATPPKVTIGENGNWFVDGIDTGKPSRGENGTNGIDGKTPTITIGDNGNWWVDGTDTTKPAKGADGKSPEVVIGENGNWYIDGTDTTKPAFGKPGKEGTKGKTAYELWVDEVAKGVKNPHADGEWPKNKNSQADFWEYLQGAPGVAGTPGTPGEPGKPGEDANVGITPLKFVSSEIKDIDNMTVVVQTDPNAKVNINYEGISIDAVADAAGEATLYFPRQAQDINTIVSAKTDKKERSHPLLVKILGNKHLRYKLLLEKTQWFKQSDDSKVLNPRKEWLDLENRKIMVPTDYYVDIPYEGENINTIQYVISASGVWPRGVNEDEKFLRIMTPSTITDYANYNAVTGTITGVNAGETIIDEFQVLEIEIDYIPVQIENMYKIDDNTVAWKLKGITDEEMAKVGVEIRITDAAGVEIEKHRIWDQNLEKIDINGELCWGFKTSTEKLDYLTAGSTLRLYIGKYSSIHTLGHLYQVGPFVCGGVDATGAGTNPNFEYAPYYRTRLRLD